MIFAGFPHLYAKSLPFKFNSKLGRTFRSRRNKLKLDELRAKVQEASSTMAGERGDQRKTFRDFITLGVQGIAFSVSRPNVEANKFELKSVPSSMVQQSQFGTPH